MSLLDRLLGENWESQVRSTFSPKRYDTLAAGDFTPSLSGGFADRPFYEQYLDLLEEGYIPTAEGYDLYTDSDALITSGNTTSATDHWNEVKRSLLPGHEDFGKYWVHPDTVETANIFDPASLMKGFERAGMEDVTSDMVKPFKASDIRKIDPASYTKEIESGRGDLATQLQERLASAAGVGSGFSGYGGRSTAQDLARQQYEQGSASLLAEANKARASAVKSLYSQLQDYDQLINRATS